MQKYVIFKRIEIKLQNLCIKLQMNLFFMDVIYIFICNFINLFCKQFLTKLHIYILITFTNINLKHFFFLQKSVTNIILISVNLI